jgi:hypothetical protein
MLYSVDFFHPTHNSRPMLFKRPPPHEQTEMIARGDLVAEIFRRRSHQPLRCQQLFRGNHFVGAPGKKMDRKQQTREVDRLAEGDEASASEFVALV